MAKVSASKLDFTNVDISFVQRVVTAWVDVFHMNFMDSFSCNRYSYFSNLGDGGKLGLCVNINGIGFGLFIFFTYLQETFSVDL